MGSIARAAEFRVYFVFYIGKQINKGYLEFFKLFEKSKALSDYKFHALKILKMSNIPI